MCGNCETPAASTSRLFRKPLSEVIPGFVEKHERHDKINGIFFFPTNDFTMTNTETVRCSMTALQTTQVTGLPPSSQG